MADAVIGKSNNALKTSVAFVIVFPQVVSSVP